VQRDEQNADRVRERRDKLRAGKWLLACQSSQPQTLSIAGHRSARSRILDSHRGHAIDDQPVAGSNPTGTQKGWARAWTSWTLTEVSILIGLALNPVGVENRDSRSAAQ